jgi:hypothetical protein
MLTPALRSKVDALWDKSWSGGIANPSTAIEWTGADRFSRVRRMFGQEET